MENDDDKDDEDPSGLTTDFGVLIMVVSVEEEGDLLEVVMEVLAAGDGLMGVRVLKGDFVACEKDDLITDVLGVIGWILMLTFPDEFLLKKLSVVLVTVFDVPLLGELVVALLVIGGSLLEMLAAMLVMF